MGREERRRGWGKRDRERGEGSEKGETNRKVILINQWHFGGINLESASRERSDLYSYIW